MSGIPAGAGQLLGKRLGKFEILALLALGGTAEIYLARIGGAAGFEKYVVVKCLHDHLADDAEFVKMFLDEARLAAHLDHSNIVQTMELGQHDGRYYMVMEFLAGLSLAMIVRRAAERLPGGRVPVPLVLNILAQSCAGLHYAHEKAMNGKPLNIVHRDISPQNLVISFEGVVKIVDFGIAKAEMRETRTRSGTIKGKFAYMSPEQCVANNVDRRTDVFALGVIGHELLTGRRLFKRPSPYETYQAVIECDVKPPSELDPTLDPELDRVLMGALTKDKDARYPTAEAFGDALLGYLHHRGIGSGHGDVSRFFDQFFAQELDEHSARMRELISGRDLSVDTGVNWRDEEEDAAAGSSGSLRVTGELEANRGSASSLSGLMDDLGVGSRGEDDDEMPAERTRIESNPLERVNEMHRQAEEAAAAAAAPAPPKRAPTAQVKSAKPKSEPMPIPRVAKSARLPSVLPGGGVARAATAGDDSAANGARQPRAASSGTTQPRASTSGPEKPRAATAQPRAATAQPRAATAGPAQPRASTTAPETAVSAAAEGGAPGDAAVPTSLPMGGPPPTSLPMGGPPPTSLPMGGRTPSGRFPDPANLPTMIAAETAPIEPFPPEPANIAPNVPSGLIGAPMDVPDHPTLAPDASGFDHLDTTVAPQLPLPSPAPNAFTANAPTSIAPLPQDFAATAVPPPAEAFGNAPTALAPDLQPPPAPAIDPRMAGYPVMSAQMSEQIATGATVFPSSGAPPLSGAMHAMPPSGAHAMPPSGAHAMPPSGAHAMPPSGMHAMPSSGMHAMPPSGALGLHTPPGVPPSGPHGYPMLPGRGRDGDPQRAADLMSPVGASFGEHVDWAEAAAKPARAVPPWLLAILFIGAIGIALAITVIAARALR